MASIEISISGQKFVLKGEDSEEHLKEVAEMVRRKVESNRKDRPQMGIQKAAMLSAFDLASEVIKGRKKAVEYRSAILSKAGELLKRIESELATSPTFQ